jgi:hypothetical protein
MVFEPQKFTPNNILPEVVKPEYNHGFSEEEVYNIEKAKEELGRRDLLAQPVTLEEFKNIIVPFLRIKRTEAFILNPIKEKKVRVPREKLTKEPKPPKVKKLTKKEIKEKIDNLIFKKVMGEELTEEENIFFIAQTGG